MKWKLICFAIFHLVFLTQSLRPLDDPYQILGVKKSSTVQEIRKAYKKLAKEWHPDKNDNPEAAAKFVEITQAYELLTDPERRKQYDRRGIIDPDSSHRNRQDHQFDEFDPFEDIFNFPHKFRFATDTVDAYFFQKLSVTTRAFENNLLPKSAITPQLIVFYSDWCFSCSKIERVLRRVIEELEPIGVDLATVNSGEEPLLTKKCGVEAVPALILLIDGKTYPFKESVLSLHNIVEFIRSKFPYNLITNVRDDSIDSFLDGWDDNRVRALVFEKNENIRLRYLLMAFHYSERVSFGFVHLDSPDTVEIQRKYKVSSELDTLLLFNENTNKSMASLSMSAIPVKAMKDVISANKFLILPRLSSQKVMDSVCPIEWARRRKRLCVILVSENTIEHEESRQAMREFVQEATYSSERVRFSYIFRERQEEFMKSLSVGSPDEIVLNIVILWRRDASHVKYEWMQENLVFNKASSEWNKTKEKLDTIISKLLKTDESLAYEAVVKELIDEQAQGLIGRIVSKFIIAINIVTVHIGKNHILTLSSLVGTVAFIVGGGYLMAYLVRQEEERLKFDEKRNGYQKSNNSKSEDVSTPELRLLELRAERYNGMVRLLKPGCRSIILLLDSQSFKTLLPDFHTAAWPYRKNKSLLFGYMFIDKGLEWYKKLLIMSLPEPRKLDINPRNCIGTVLSLNGHRRYFCMYHAKHPERNRTQQKSRRIIKGRKRLNESEDVVEKIGSFIGFEDSADSESDGSVDLEQGTLFSNDDMDSKVLFQSNLLKGLPNWLDRLFEGTTHRYYISYWPEFSAK